MLSDTTKVREWQAMMQRRITEYRAAIAREEPFMRAAATALMDTLEALVPFKIHEYAQKGGPDDNDLVWVAEYGKQLGYSATSLMYFSNGTTASEANPEPELSSRETIRGMIRAVAIMSFFPGGICALGVYFDAGAPDRTGASQPIYGVLPSTRQLLEDLWREKAGNTHA